MSDSEFDVSRDFEEACLANLQDFELRRLPVQNGLDNHRTHSTTCCGDSGRPRVDRRPQSSLQRQSSFYQHHLPSGQFHSVRLEPLTPLDDRPPLTHFDTRTSLEYCRVVPRDTPSRGWQIGSQSNVNKYCRTRAGNFDNWILTPSMNFGGGNWAQRIRTFSALKGQKIVHVHCVDPQDVHPMHPLDTIFNCDEVYPDHACIACGVDHGEYMCPYDASSRLYEFAT